MTNVSTNFGAALVFASLSWCAAGTARASTSHCDTAGDGSPCTEACVTEGFCDHGRCRALTYAVDGSSCSTGNPCSRDVCYKGECQPTGDQVHCPDRDACHQGICLPTLGCSFQNICKPEQSPAGPPTPDAPPETTPPGTRMAPGVVTPSGTIVDVPPGEPSGPNGQVTSGHVTGGALGGCSVAPGSARGFSWCAFFFLAAALAVAKKRRGLASRASSDRL